MLISGKCLEKKILEKENMDIVVKVDDTQITEVNCQKLLGATIDNRLNYEEHIDRLCRKLSKQLGLSKSIETPKAGSPDYFGCRKDDTFNCYV
jgi:hypothetical protein